MSALFCGRRFLSNTDDGRSLSCRSLAFWFVMSPMISSGALTVASQCFQIGSALSKNTASILVFRFLGGTFAAAPLANSGYVMLSPFPHVLTSMYTQRFDIRHLGSQGTRSSISCLHCRPIRWPGHRTYCWRLLISSRGFVALGILDYRYICESIPSTSHKVSNMFSGRCLLTTNHFNRTRNFRVGQSWIGM